MAKRHKKQNKINQSIKDIFGGFGFDEGIDRVDTDTLLAINMALKFNSDDLSRETLLKSLRRAYSEADSEERNEILHLLKSFITSDLSLEQHDDMRQEKLETILSTLVCTQEENDELNRHFIQSSRKLTPAKVESKLQALRIVARQKELAKRLNGTFNENGRFSFTHTDTINFAGETFDKSFNIDTRGFQPGEFAKKDILERIEEEKNSSLNTHNEKLNLLLDKLKDHPYLENNFILNALKSLSKHSELSYLELQDETLSKLFKPLCSQVNIIDESFILYFDEIYPLFGKTDILFSTQAQLHRRTILKEITAGREIKSFFNTEKLNSSMIKNFEDQLDELLTQCQNASSIINLSSTDIQKILIEPIIKQVSKQSLNISPKRMRSIFTIFMQEINPKIIHKQKEALLSRTIRDFKNMFGRARVMGRKLHFFMGPTNSGKTYQAMQHLKSADTGYYLAPLRLLALEGYENLKEDGVEVSLITGEEQQENPFASHISSTIEMLNFNTAVDVAVIDEVQMLNDPQRGWAWVNAIIGVSAKNVYMTGSEDALNAIKIVASWLEEPLDVIKCERKNPLTLMSNNTTFDNLEPSTAIIAFSRKQVLTLKHRLHNKFKTSVIYGSLSPEVRREEAKRFRRGETQLLIATDAIAMGLNLPIKTILFSQSTKFDGQNIRALIGSEVRQIAGRSGRYGLHEEGYVGAIYPDVLKDIGKILYTKSTQIEPPFAVAATLDQVNLISTILLTHNLEEILDFFASNMHFDGPFKAHNIEQMREVAKVVDRYELDLKSKFHLSGAPVALNIAHIEKVFLRYVRAIESATPITFEIPKDLQQSANTQEELLTAEDRIKEITLYLWLSYRFKELFVDSEVAIKARRIINRYIENSLQNQLLIHKDRHFKSNYSKKERSHRKRRR